jgi:hypothetical protein
VTQAYRWRPTDLPATLESVDFDVEADAISTVPVGPKSPHDSPFTCTVALGRSSPEHAGPTDHVEHGR